jgi:hypothetical protein
MSEREHSATVLVPSRRDTVIELVFMLGALGPVLVSAYVSFATGEGHWFQRSGALMVLFSVAVEYHRRRMAERSVPVEREDGLRPSRFKHLFAKFWGNIPYVCYMAIAVGTLIWSYGDLLFD